MRPLSRWISVSTIPLVTVAPLGVISAGSAQAVYAATANTATAPRYSIVDLGITDTFLPQGSGPATSSVATDVNNHGVVVGYVEDLAGGKNAFRWTAGVLTDITGPYSSSKANAINDTGQIAGEGIPPGGSFTQPASWSATNVVRHLGGTDTLQIGAGNDIDPSGRVVGGENAPGTRGGPSAVRYEVDGTPTNLGTPSDNLPIASGTNARGQVVVGHFVWDNGALTPLPGLDPEAPDSAAAFAINASGTAVGDASVNVLTNAGTHATMWRNGTVTDLGTLDGDTSNVAKAINASGQLVGASSPQALADESVAYGDNRAWFWQSGLPSLTPLDSLIPPHSGWTLKEANGINDKGQIVGAGLHNGLLHGFLLTPTGAPRFAAHINFGPAGAATPVGYTTDTGAVYGIRASGQTYGWNADNSANTRDRDSALSAGQRYDLLTQMQRPGGARTWELAVPDGSYTVHVVSGDASYLDSNYQINVEGELTVSGTPSAAQHWLEGTTTVTVTDGRLTVTNATGSNNNKLNYIDIASTG